MLSNEGRCDVPMHDYRWGLPSKMTLSGSNPATSPASVGNIHSRIPFNIPYIMVYTYPIDDGSCLLIEIIRDFAEIHAKHLGIISNFS